MISQAGYLVNCVNPIITKKYQKSSVRGAKNDRIDAARLAHIGLVEEDLPIFSASLSQISAQKQLASKQQLDQIYQQLDDHLRQLKNTAQTLGLPLEQIIRELEQLKKFIKQSREWLDEVLIAQADQEVVVPMSELPGVSAKQIAILSAFLAGRFFSTDDQLVAFLGLNVRVRESGTWKGRQKLTKRGNSFIRKVLFQIGWGLSRHHPYYHQMYYDRRARGRTHKEAIIIITRSFLRTFFRFYWQNEWRFQTV